MEYYYLISYSITSFRYLDTWEEELFPYLYALRDGTADIDDWNGFAWGGTICFRYDHIMTVDDDEFYKHGTLARLWDDLGNQVLNDEGTWLNDTEFIEKNNQNYFAKISLEKYIYYCKEWAKIIKKLYGL
ncbi:MAG: hypothetical protein LBI72_05790 [Flavobacteriaceae bacterium]|nr:hypothetical protein [Flavobacteriaceae bacterium]